ncbi:MAG: polysaccharide biosynthesis C-terminal domain-containing protein [Dermatophilaceae bacterium]
MRLTRSVVSGLVRGRGAGLAGRTILGNMGARAIALASVAVVTILVARAGGAEDVGLLALMRVLPGLVGVLAACGLPSAMGYFVAGEERSHPGLWPTILVIMGFGAAVGGVAWWALTPVIHDRLMPTTTTMVVAVVGVTVVTQLPVAVGKACLQALGDSRGANVIIAAEEAAFVPAYGIGWALGLRSGWLLVTALIIADVVVAIGAWAWIWRDVHRAGDVTPGRPERALAGRLLRFGMRSQVGGVVNLLNLRLDVVLLGAFAGPAPVGIYVVASKFAELLRLPSLALTWVAYPRVAQEGAANFARRAQGAVTPLLGLGSAAALVVGLVAFPLLPLAYGSEFAAATWPAALIALGLVAEPAAGLASGYLMGSGRPGVNSVILGVGLIVTVVLDVVLIPRHGAIGAAVASAVAYLTTDLVLIAAMRRVIHSSPPPDVHRDRSRTVTLESPPPTSMSIGRGPDRWPATADPPRPPSSGVAT